MISFWDSRVGHGVASKGRSSSVALNRCQRAALPDLLGAGLCFEGLWCPSPWMPADGPSRGRRPRKPTASEREDADRLLQGRAKLVDEAELAAWRNDVWDPVEWLDGVSLEKRTCKPPARQASTHPPPSDAAVDSEKTCISPKQPPVQNSLQPKTRSRRCVISARGFCRRKWMPLGPLRALRFPWPYSQGRNVCIDLLGGSGRWASAMRSKGFLADVYDAALDSSMDLFNPLFREFLLRRICTGSVFWLQVAVACGTFSLACRPALRIQGHLLERSGMPPPQNRQSAPWEHLGRHLLAAHLCPGSLLWVDVLREPRLVISLEAPWLQQLG